MKIIDIFFCGSVIYFFFLFLHFFKFNLVYTEYWIIYSYFYTSTPEGLFFSDKIIY